MVLWNTMVNTTECRLSRVSKGTDDNQNRFVPLKFHLKKKYCMSFMEKLMHLPIISAQFYENVLYRMCTFLPLNPLCLLLSPLFVNSFQLGTKLIIQAQNSVIEKWRKYSFVPLKQSKTHSHTIKLHSDMQKYSQWILHFQSLAEYWDHSPV